MSAKNVEIVRAAHDSWNKRDFVGTVKDMADNVVYTDHARGIDTHGRDEFRKYLESWAKGFSDGRISDPEYIDAGDTVVAQFTATGTNDGQFGSLQPTGKRISVPFCEITRFNREGKIVSGANYHDLYTLLAQLGYAKPLPAAA